MRAFTAIELPEELRARIYDLTKKIPGNITEVSKENLHVTMHFFEEIGEDRIKDISETLDSIKVSRFKASVHGLSHFGGKEINVIYAKVFDNRSIKRMYYQISRDLQSKGIFFDTGTDFTPHITLARVKMKADPNLRDFINENAEYSFGDFEVNSISLKRSVLGGSGPEYTTIASSNF